ncbi:hypothetical protein QWJ26_26550 [Streptomyces sp. CSDS2]|uniref:hypothetical protein n=1 Tax=Streptomyces sp. CSDS2 TaxID=3055051 RepID=UPI0025B2719E|nr:hypothetical protein [Streptomyces sp. CSDS2]MDN3263306.1 hypothetical protein [Streptomyces sp. CSDS2]
MNQPASPQVGNSTTPLAGEPTKPLVVKYTTHLPADMVKQVKREAVEREVKDYQVVTEALREFFAKQEVAA